ncbi:L-fuculose-phosphate aldolase [Parasporobacterium paucivorans]|uniref:L-fuculose 1-phosphate aldolase n=1 Tax=Parasporobacterium paucivorans DSM 15970 TaxID=1122934 RepID=A0A1M6J7P4_9FIRM|nr:L-fuculose-phosphate aldolase [Parasporobacterium paucivorans]SHJ42733.1 L-fuculose 1-phosphate aldolase [Parasporobacterium paucivorans DSM 15970]
MLMEKERTELVDGGIIMLEKGFTKGTSGNLSIYNRELQLMAITPSGMDYRELKPEDMVVMNLQGTVVEGERKPSSEYMLHAILYENRWDLNSVVHAHTVSSTTIACLREDLPAVTYMLAVAGKSVKCAKYATFGTRELALNALEAMQDNNAVLLANHGVVTGGESMKKALDILEQVEYAAELYYRTRCIGQPEVIEDEEMTRIMKKFKMYGQK